MNKEEILLVANKLIKSGQVQEAIDRLIENYQQQAKSPEIHFLLIQLLQQQGAFKQAAVIISDAELKFQDLASLTLLKSNQAQNTGQPELAIELLQQLLNSNPNFPFAWASLGQLQEQLNHLDELKITLDQIPDEYICRPLIALVRAKYFRRVGDHKEALWCLDSIQEKSILGWQKSMISYEYSRIYDKLECYNEAWSSAVKANQQLSQNWPFESLDKTVVDTLLNNHAKVMSPQSSFGENNRTHCFLVGFPRSGTTLLEKILDSHSDIEVLDEQPIIENIVWQLGGYEYLNKLETINAEEIEKYRNEYFQSVNALAEKFKNSRCLIDKLPLNILYLPLIQRLFPDAKILLANRHPIDSCLSCFFQEFKAMPLLENFLNFDSTVNFYQQVFSFSMRFIEDNQNCFSIRYEDILENVEVEISTLLEFLGLGWQPQQQAFYKHAKKQKINTPSYHQVTQPLYNNSKYRWRHYKKYCQTAELELAKWIKLFNYDQNKINEKELE